MRRAAPFVNAQAGTQAFPGERIERSTLVLRGHKVRLDADLAALYGAETRVAAVTVTAWQNSTHCGRTA